MGKTGMTMMLAARNRSNRGGNQGGQINNEMRGNYGMESALSGRRMENEMRGGYGMESNYDVESRFRDRRGREHYGNGRFAPMRNEMNMGYHEPWSGGERTYDIDINRYEYEPKNRSGGMNMGGSGMEMRRGESMRGGNEMRMIGFNRPENDMRMGADATVPHYHEMDRMQGDHSHMKGGAKAHGSPMFDEHMAHEWTSMMENEDGTKGPHWTLEQAKKVMETRNLRCDPYEFWAVLNAIYSDDVAVAKKHGINKMDYYVDRAISWLSDKDAVPGKAGAYFEYVVKH